MSTHREWDRGVGGVQVQRFKITRSRSCKESRHKESRNREERKWWLEDLNNSGVKESWRLERETKVRDSKFGSRWDDGHVTRRSKKLSKRSPTSCFRSIGSIWNESLVTQDYRKVSVESTLVKGRTNSMNLHEEGSY